MPVSNYVSRPSLTGWHLLTFQNGDTAVARWNGSNFVWGSLTAPASPITGITYLGKTISDVTSGNSIGLGAALAGLPSQLSTAITTAFDAGNLGTKGQPALWNSAGQPLGNTSVINSEAVPVNVIPSPIPPTAGNSNLGVSNPFALFTSSSFWKGIGLVLAGAVILIFAAIEFGHMANVSVPVPKV